VNESYFKKANARVVFEEGFAKETTKKSGGGRNSKKRARYAGATANLREIINK